MSVQVEQNITSQTLLNWLGNIDNSVFIQLDLNVKKVDVSKENVKFTLRYEVTDETSYHLTKDFSSKIVGLSCRVGNKDFEIPCETAELENISASLNLAVHNRFGWEFGNLPTGSLSERSVRDQNPDIKPAGSNFTHPQTTRTYVKH